MIERLRKAHLLWPTLAAIAGLAVLVGLGDWQLQRKRWKEGLIARIDTRAHADPVPLAALGPAAKGGEKNDVEYTRVSVRGRFLHDKERYLFAPDSAGPGWHVYTPLQIDSQHFVWINRGFVPDRRKAPGTRPEGQVPGEVEVHGLVRLPRSRSVFAAENDPTRNFWYWPDLPAMTASAFPEGPHEAAEAPQRPVGLPLVIDADATPGPPGGVPRGGVTRLQLPNRHLEYALTWYGLGATLVGVYLAFAISRLRAAS